MKTYKCIHGGKSNICKVCLRPREKDLGKRRRYWGYVFKDNVYENLN